ncbi:MAG: NAD(P)H-dependent oxidoreductase [Spirochaetes bacterium]|nr:NAD(P)H-dependent oxidoreductase [Spirochaetota bacterium]
MRILMITAHPNPHGFNQIVSNRLEKRLIEGGIEVDRTNLYQEGFDPVLSVEEMLRKGSFDRMVIQQVEKLNSSTGLLLVHPDWWGLPPAILKGWVDRVLLPGVGYVYEEGVGASPLLEHLRGAVLVTRDNPGSGLSEAFWLKEVFPLCGIAPTWFRVLDGLKIQDPYEVERRVAVLLEELYTFLVSK